MAQSKGRPSRVATIRRSRSRGLGRLLQGIRTSWHRLLELRSLWFVIFLVLGTWLLIPGGILLSPKVEVGTIAARDYVAPHDLLLLDEETTREKRGRARDAILPVYDFDPGIITELDEDFGRLFAEGRDLLRRAPARGRSGEELGEELAAALEVATGLKITPEVAQLLAQKEFSPDLEDRIRGAVTQVLRRGVVGSKALLLENRLRGVTLRNLQAGTEREDLDLYDHLGYPEEVRDSLAAELRSWMGLTPRQRTLMVEFLVRNIRPNLHLNRSETLARREAAAQATDPVFTQIRKGQVIARKGDQIDATAAQAIAQIAGERTLWSRLLPLLGTLLLLGMVALVVWLGLKNEKVADHSPQRLFSESLLLLLMSLLGAKFTFLVAQALSNSFNAAPFNSLESYTYAIPFASLALVGAMLCGRNTALVLSLIFSLLVSRLTEGGGLPVVIYSMAGSLAAIYALEQYQFRQRLVMTRVGLVVGSVNMVTILLLASLTPDPTAGNILQLGFHLVCGMAGGLLTSAVASFTVPILESLLSITTDIKLVELANTNLPLLRRLAFEAPGTFQHSLMVANLAKEGCEVIGADPVMAYTGGLYHDVGKIFRPEYFVENQRPGQNPHDKLSPSMSALILINHIKDGLELAREYHLPRPIVDAIAQHHGTRLIKYFYSRAQERADPETEEVTEEKYRYPGPRPQSKVMGVLMLADAVEAASRTLVEPTPAKIRTVVRTIVEDCLRDGQLDETDLTLGDLKRIGDAFLRVLSNIFHQRVDYPGFDFGALSGEGPQRPATQSARVS